MTLLEDCRSLRGAKAANGGKLYLRLAEQIGREIVDGRRPPGSLLPSAAEMCAAFAVSRTTLREAYSILIAKALIEARPRTGTRIRASSEWNLLDPEVLAWRLEATPSRRFIGDLLALCEMVEPGAAALAASHLSPAAYEKIAEACERLERPESTSAERVAADLDFHMAILEASGNRLLATIGGVIRDAALRAFRARRRDGRHFAANGQARHRALLEAIRSQAPALAQRRMSQLLNEARLRVDEATSRQSAESAPPPRGERFGALKGTKARSTASPPLLMQQRSESP